jgi:hypothetical protein
MVYVPLTRKQYNICFELVDIDSSFELYMSMSHLTRINNFRFAFFKQFTSAKTNDHIWLRPHFDSQTICYIRIR